MGLDQYLYKRTYVKTWDFAKSKYNITITTDDNSHNIRRERINYIIEEVGYWRKFNALHQWFVDNIQEGNDNCQEHYIPKESLEELLDICIKINANHNLAKELLPCVEGFFFGGTDYDDYYFEQIQYTITLLTECINDMEGDYYYNSSW